MKLLTFFSKLTLTACLFFNIFTPQVSLAQAGTCNQSIFPDLVVCGRSQTSSCTNQQEPCKIKHIPIVLGNLIQWIILLLLFALPIFLMYLGIQMILNQGMPGKMAALKGKILWTVVCLIVIFSSWLIIREITRIFGVSRDVPSFLLNDDGSVYKFEGAPLNN